jgi:hypothetical protein
MVSSNSGTSRTFVKAKVDAVESMLQADTENLREQLAPIVWSRLVAWPRCRRE